MVCARKIPFRWIRYGMFRSVHEYIIITPFPPSQVDRYKLCHEQTFNLINDNTLHNKLSLWCWCYASISLSPALAELFCAWGMQCVCYSMVIENMTWKFFSFISRSSFWAFFYFLCGLKRPRKLKAYFMTFKCLMN